MKPRSATRSAAYHARRIHRWLGLFIGVQFVLWTVGGMYVSWMDLEAVHGDPPMRPARPVSADSGAGLLVLLVSTTHSVVKPRGLTVWLRGASGTASPPGSRTHGGGAVEWRLLVAPATRPLPHNAVRLLRTPRAPVCPTG